MRSSSRLHYIRLVSAACGAYLLYYLWWRLSVHLPDGPLPLAGELVFNQPLKGGQLRLGVRFRRMSLAARERLVAFLIS
jgi:hypothetical protein